MTVYSVILFIHLLGALALFAGLGFEWRALRFLSQAKTLEEVRLWTGAGAVLPKLNGFAAAAVLLPGFYLATKMQVWPQGWISMALLGTFAIAGLGAGVTGPRMRAVRKASMEGSGPLPGEVEGRVRAPLLRTSFRLRLWLGLGIVLLMASRPGYGISIAVIAVSVIAAFAIPL
ncbi:MAG TPA: hypothetical protein VLV49_12295 [Terriglobales bacterium]|nr:hypothetical protein [Terriglobales bacterium]